MSTQLPLLIYDPDCVLCVRFKQGLELVLKKDTINFVSVKDEELFKSFPELSFTDCLAKIHYIDQTRKIFTGEEVIEELVKITPGVSRFAWLLQTDSGKNAVNFFYQKVEELRSILKEKDSCKDCG